MADIDPRLEGYTEWKSQDPFEDFVGPLYYKKEDDGGYRCAFIIADQHTNGQGGLHGGMNMTFADYCLFILAMEHLDEQRAVTVTFNAEFIAVANKGDLVEAKGEIVHETRGMLFLRGQVTSGGRILLNFSSLLKKLRPKDTPS